MHIVFESANQIQQCVKGIASVARWDFPCHTQVVPYLAINGCDPNQLTKEESHISVSPGAENHLVMSVTYLFMAKMLNKLQIERPQLHVADLPVKPTLTPCLRENSALPLLLGGSRNSPLSSGPHIVLEALATMIRQEKGTGHKLG